MCRERSVLRLWSSVLCLGFLVLACTPQGDPALESQGFVDRFEGGQLKPWWRNTGGPYQVRGGRLHVQGAKNHPLWLRRRLPHDVRIEFDAESRSAAGDLKFEVFGDGLSHATTERYTATSYVVILGGWNNSSNLVARMDEHGSAKATGPLGGIRVGHRYRIRLERRGRTLTVWLDGKRWMHYRDPAPLTGRGHDHFGWNNWDSDVSFDNLKITPLSP